MNNNTVKITINWLVPILGTITFIIMLLLKVSKAIEVSWFWVFFPLWLSWAIWFLAVQLLIFLILLMVRD